MIRDRFIAVLGCGLCVVTSQGIAQQAPPPIPPSPPPAQQQPGQQQPGQQPPQGQNEGNQRPRNESVEATEDEPGMIWYNGDYAAKSISPVTTIDDPVTGFGNEALWTNAARPTEPAQSDIARSAEPD